MPVPSFFSAISAVWADQKERCGKTASASLSPIRTETLDTIQRCEGDLPGRIFGSHWPTALGEVKHCIKHLSSHHLSPRTQSTLLFIPRCPSVLPVHLCLTLPLPPPHPPLCFPVTLHLRSLWPRVCGCVCVRHWRYCNSPSARATLYSLNLHSPDSPASGGVSPTPKTLPPPLFSNRQEWIKECIDVTPALKEKLRAIWMRRRTQWPCFGHVSLVNERDHSEQLLCRLPADLTVLQLVDIVPSAAQTIEESFGWVFTPDLAST